MTLTLTPDTEAVLQTLAAQRGQAPEQIVEALVRHAAQEERERQETLSGLRQSVQQFAAGQWVALEDLGAEHDAWKAAHLPANGPDTA